MLWAQILLFALIVPDPAKTCSCKTGGTAAYQLGPSDTDFGSTRILRVGGRVVVLKRSIGASTDQIYLSQEGEKWRRASRQEELALSHVVSASGTGDGKTIYRILGDYSALEGSSILERSTDEGENWTRAQLQFSVPANPSGKAQQRQTRLRVLGINSLTLYASIAVRSKAEKDWNALPGVYVSRDGGDHWQLFSTNLQTQSAVVEANGRVFGLSNTGLVESTDDGRTWSLAAIGRNLPSGFPLSGFESAPLSRRSKQLEIYQLEFQPGDPDSAFAVTNGGLFITHDDGKTWCLVTFGSDMMYTVQSVLTDGSRVLATTADQQGPRLWESKNSGQTFRPLILGSGPVSTAKTR